MPRPQGKKLLVRVPHEELDLPKLEKHLEEDLVYIFFRKVTNGQFRGIYPFTRNPKYIPLSENQSLLNLYTQPIPEINIQRNRGVLVKAYSLLDRGWRSFYTENLLFYEVYDPEGDTLE